MKLTTITTAIALSLTATTSMAGIGPDKVLHAGAGILTAVTGKAIGFTDKQACAASLAVGIAKEVIDPIFSIPDVVATAIICVPILLSNGTAEEVAALPADFSPAIPYPGYAQVGIMYSKDNGTFFKATASAGGVTHTRYTADREVSSSVFIPYNDDDAVVTTGSTESAIAALMAGGMTKEQATASVATSEAKAKKAKSNASEHSANGSNDGNGGKSRDGSKNSDKGKP